MKISVITVCLNSEKTIERTIQSVVGQRADDCEYIIVDGKSSDRTLEIVEKYRNEISILVSEQDKGLYDAMNKGIALASGDIIGILNSDDWYEPGVFEIVRKCFSESDAEVVYGRMNLIDENEDVCKIQTPSDIERLRFEMEIPHATVFVKREIYQKYGGFDLKYRIAADYDLMLRLFTKGVKFYYSPQVFANFRLGGTAMQQAEKCVEETMTISKKYLPCAPLEKRQSLKNKIFDIYKVFYFVKLVKDASDNLPEILNKKLGVPFEEDIAIFGAGIWGWDIWHVLNNKGVKVQFFVDNDKEKWEVTKNGVRICAPKVLQSFEGVLLVIVKDFSNEILLQIKEMCNESLYCVTLDEIISEYIKLGEI